MGERSVGLSMICQWGEVDGTALLGRGDFGACSRPVRAALAIVRESDGLHSAGPSSWVDAICFAVLARKVHLGAEHSSRGKVPRGYRRNCAWSAESYHAITGEIFGGSRRVYVSDVQM